MLCLGSVPLLLIDRNQTIKLLLFLYIDQMSHVEPYFSFFQQKGKRNCSFGYTAITFYRFCHILWKQFDFYEKQRVSLPAV